MKIDSTGKSEPLHFKGGYGTLIIAGDLEGLTVTVEADYGLGEWILQRDLDGEPITITEPSAVNFLTCKCDLRLSVEGDASDDPSDELDLDWSIRTIPMFVLQNR